MPYRRIFATPHVLALTVSSFFPSAAPRAPFPLARRELLPAAPVGLGLPEAGS